MAKTHGKDAVFWLDNSGGTLTNLSTYLNSTQLARDMGLSDTTAFGDGGTKTVPGLKNATVPIGGPWDPTLDAHMHNIGGIAATQSFEFGPEGGTSTKVKYSGECRIANYSFDTSVADAITWSAELQVDGEVTRGTFA